MIKKADQLVDSIIQALSKMRRENHAFPVEIRMDAPTTMLLRMYYWENMDHEFVQFMGMSLVIDNAIPPGEFRMLGEEGPHRVELAA